jgi:tetratricopeptide (TPR) repeat protein
MDGYFVRWDNGASVQGVAPMRFGTAFLLVMIGTAASANAAVTVIGQGPAHDCYVAAERDFGAMASEDLCTMALYDTMISLRDRAATLVNRGVIRTRLGRLEAALLDNDQAIAIGEHMSSSDLGIAYVNRASILNGLGRHKEAVESANKGIGLGAGNVVVGYYARAVAEEMLGDVVGAYHDYKQALVLKPDFTPAVNQLTRFRVQSHAGEGS